MGVLHQNIISLSGKVQGELLIETGLKSADVLCFTKHWLNSQKLHAINIDYYMLANSFCRTVSKHGGSCVCVKENIATKELNYLHKLGEEKNLCYYLNI